MKFLLGKTIINKSLGDILRLQKKEKIKKLITGAEDIMLDAWSFLQQITQ